MPLSARELSQLKKIVALAQGLIDEAEATPAKEKAAKKGSTVPTRRSGKEAEMDPKAVNSCMRISEIITPADQQRVNSLDRSAKQATYAVKQERYRQRLKSYSDRIRKQKPGSKPPQRPEPPKPPTVT